MRALFEIVVNRKWALMAGRILALCRVVEHRVRILKILIFSEFLSMIFSLDLGRSASADGFHRISASPDAAFVGGCCK